MSLKVNPVLCRAGVMDNYAYIITDEKTGVSAVIDASEAEPVILKCRELGLKPQYILTTHHHFDHVGGNEELKALYNLLIIGPEEEKNLIPGIDKGVGGGETLFLGKTKIEVISAPGHTLGHVLWYFPDEKLLFTGDVLFNLCIGGIFEGTTEQMWESLQKIKALPDDVLFYPGHEYTAHCLADAIKRENSVAMQAYAEHARKCLAAGLPVAPVSLEMEKQCNPYLRIENKKNFEQLF